MPFKETSRMNNKRDWNAPDFEYRLSLIINGYLKNCDINTMIQILKDAIMDLELKKKVKKGLKAK